MIERSPRASRILRIAAMASVCVGVAFVLSFVYFAVRARFTVPYVDDWSLLASLQNGPLVSLFAPHNEHIMAVPRLLVWADHRYWGWPGYATLAASLLCHVAVVGLFFVLSRHYPTDEARLLIGLVMVSTLTTYALQGAVFPSAVNFSLVFGLGALAVAAVASSPGAPHPARRALLGLVPASLAMLSVTNGFAVPIVLTGLSICLRLPALVTVACVALAGIGAVVRYTLGGVPGSAMLASPLAVAEFTLAILAGPTASLSPRLAVGVGAALAIAGGIAVFRFIRDPSGPALRPFIAGIVSFSLISAAMTAMGRAQFDLSVAAESRYAEVASLTWAALFYVLIPPGATARPLGRFLALVLPLLALATLPAQWLVGRVWAGKADHLGVAALTLTTAVPDADWTWTLHPLGRPVIDPALPVLERRHVAFLQFPDRGQRVGVGAAAACSTGSAEAFEAPWATDGLRVHATIATPGRRLRVLDRDARIVGLALPAPAASSPRAAANDFVWAEVDRLAGRLDPRGTWLGLSDRGAGAPYSAQLMDERGAVICALPVACCAQEPVPRSRGELVVRGGMAEGHVDRIDCTSVSGWVWDPARPDAPLEVRIASDTGGAVVVRADQRREDLVGAGKGNGAHGFSVATASLGLTDGRRTIRVRLHATGVELAGSPRTVTCP